jgi:A/G-specific adenine glycosylase
MLTPRRVAALRRRLLAWYVREGGEFPWRTARDPYAALVAGVCSQQTQMARVLPLWERWMAAFPTLGDAAAADEAAALRVWGRAGYPRRALSLVAAARRCAREHGGALPREEPALLALLGVGPFTAAIVRCFGFGDDAVAVDTNVVRVLGRAVHGDLQPARDTPAAALAATARRLLPRGESARWNPALMDFGARVCTPRPRCAECVVATLCAARPRFAAGERATPLRQQTAYTGSDREWRGRILGVLRETDGALAERTLLARAGATGADLPRARALLGALAREGFVAVTGGRVRLGV